MPSGGRPTAVTTPADTVSGRAGEEDLARFIGDAPANFAVRQGKKFVSAGKAAATDLLENVIEYVSEERKVLLNKRDFLIRKNELSALRDAVDRVEKRIQLLERKG